jgi:sporulation protein YlmC with PRC-barrel domain
VKRRWSTISGFPIHLEDEEEVLGRLHGVFMHPETGQITAFLVGISKVLTPVDIEKWHRESVQISTEDALVRPEEILRLQQFGLKRSFLNIKKVTSPSGRSFGRVRDFTIETTTNSVLSIHTSKKFLGIEWDRRIFPYKDIQEVTERTIILNVEPEDTQKVSKPVDAAAAA